MPETAGCQLWGTIGQFLTHQTITDKEIDAIKRRLFGFQDIMEKHEYTLADIQELSTPEDIRQTINELTPTDIAEMFY